MANPESTGEGNSENDPVKLLAEYERAQEIGLHSDAILYEVTAIIWGANTLLLGFILEVPCDSDNQKLIIAVAVLGIFMTLYVPYINWLIKKGQDLAYQICRDIEPKLVLPNRLHNRIHDGYPRWKPGRVALGVLTLSFIGVWIYVLVHALRCILGC
jgi:hypothetical protein